MIPNKCFADSWTSIAKQDCLIIFIPITQAMPDPEFFSFHEPFPHIAGAPFLNAPMP